MLFIFRFNYIKSLNPICTLNDYGSYFIWYSEGTAIYVIMRVKFDGCRKLYITIIKFGELC